MPAAPNKLVKLNTALTLAPLLWEGAGAPELLDEPLAAEVDGGAAFSLAGVATLSVALVQDTLDGLPETEDESVKSAH